MSDDSACAAVHLDRETGLNLKRLIKKYDPLGREVTVHEPPPDDVGQILQSVRSATTHLFVKNAEDGSEAAGDTGT